jgi:hypothetical protein
MRSIYRMIRSAPSSHLLDHTATLRRDHGEERPPLNTFVLAKRTDPAQDGCGLHSQPAALELASRRLQLVARHVGAAFGPLWRVHGKVMSLLVDLGGRVEIPLALPSASSRQGRPPPMTDRLAALGPARVVGSVGRWGPEAQGGNFAPPARRN